MERYNYQTFGLGRQIIVKDLNLSDGTKQALFIYEG